MAVKPGTEIAEKKKARRLFENQYESDTVADGINAIMAQVGLGRNTIRSLAEEDASLVPSIPTGITSIDSLFKGGGIPRRKIFELWGHPGSGKSYIAQRMVSEVTQRGGRAIYLDIEGGFNAERVAQLGADMRLVHVMQEYCYGEQVFDFICKIAWDEDYLAREKKPQPKPYDLIVLDSLAALGFHAELDADFTPDKDGKQKTMVATVNKAKMTSFYAPKLGAALNNSAGIWIESMSRIIEKDGFRPVDRESLGPNLFEAIEALCEARVSLRDEIADMMSGDISSDNKEELDASLPTVPPEVAELEALAHGVIVDADKRGLKMMRYNPGPSVVIINQTRTGNLGGYGLPTLTRPGGMAIQFAAGLSLQTEAIRGKKGRVDDPQNGEILGWKSKVTVIKSRYCAIGQEREFTIPFTSAGIDALQELLDTLQAKGLYRFLNRYHRIPEDGSIVKAKTKEDFYAALLEGGLDWIAEQNSWATERMDPYRELIIQQLQKMADGDGQEETEDEEQAEDSE